MLPFFQQIDSVGAVASKPRILGLGLIHLDGVLPG
jgi:hypothetical protein